MIFEMPGEKLTREQEDAILRDLCQSIPGYLDLVYEENYPTTITMPYFSELVLPPDEFDKRKKVDYDL